MTKSLEFLDHKLTEVTELINIASSIIELTNIASSTFSIYSSDSEYSASIKDKYQRMEELFNQHTWPQRKDLVINYEQLANYYSSIKDDDKAHSLRAIASSIEQLIPVEEMMDFRNSLLDAIYETHICKAKETLSMGISIARGCNDRNKAEMFEIKSTELSAMPISDLTELTKIVIIYALKNGKQDGELESYVQSIGLDFVYNSAGSEDINEVTAARIGKILEDQLQFASLSLAFGFCAGLLVTDSSSDDDSSYHTSASTDSDEEDILIATDLVESQRAFIGESVLETFER